MTASPIALRLAAVIVFAALMTLCAQVAVPMVPVPMTLQTFAILLAGVVLGPRWGLASVLLYLAAAMIGLPVLSDAASGIARFTGPTAGYLAAFIPAAILAGWLARNGRLSRPIPATAWMVALHLLILAWGTAWLALDIGMEPALRNGALPFIPGAVVKSVLVILAARALAPTFARLTPVRPARTP
ncbi:biotin transporter BioY [Brevundimonas sp.]